VTRLANSSRRGPIVLGLLVASLAVGALALPALGDMGDRDVGIVELELARTAAKASDLYGQLGDGGRDAARESLYLDYPYLVLYGLFYAAVCLVVAARAAERGMPRLASLGAVLAAGAIAAAGCDAIENLALLRVLGGHTDQPWPGIAFAFAAVKFALLAAATLYAIVGFVLTLRRRPAAA
jgi:hypothetical protein